METGEMMSGDARSRAGDRKIALVVIVAAFIFNFVARGIVDTFMVFMLPFEKEFGWSRSSLTGVYSTYLIVVGVMSPISGILLDHVGPRSVYGAGVAIIAFAMFSSSFIDEIWQVYALIGGLCGVASSLLGMVTATALIGRWVRRRVSAAMAVAYAGFGSGILVVVPLVQAGIDSYGWRTAYILIALSLSSLLPMLLLLPPSHSGKRSSPGNDGAHGKSESEIAASVQHRGWTLASAIGSREFWLLVQVFFFTACSVYIVVVQVVPYLVGAGYPPMRAALAFGASGMLSVLGVLLTGLFCARYGNRFTVTLSFAGTLMGALALLMFTQFPSPLLIFTWIVAFGLCQGARGPIISSLTVQLFAHGSAASIFGGIFMLMSFGSALGSWLSGFLYDVTGSYRTGFIFSMMFTLLACMPFWASQRLLHGESLLPPVAGKRKRTMGEIL